MTITKSSVRFLVVPVLAMAMFAGTAMVSPSAPIPSALKAEPAHASVSDCVKVARNTFAVYAGTPSQKLRAALRALASTSGCSTTLVNAICSASRQWWGYAARAIVRLVTWGKYSTC